MLIMNMWDPVIGEILQLESEPDDQRTHKHCLCPPTLIV